MPVEKARRFCGNDGSFRKLSNVTWADQISGFVDQAGGCVENHLEHNELVIT